jgi:hypothetical protein
MDMNCAMERADRVPEPLETGRLTCGQIMRGPPPGDHGEIPSKSGAPA